MKRKGSCRLGRAESACAVVLEGGCGIEDETMQKRPDLSGERKRKRQRRKELLRTLEEHVPATIPCGELNGWKNMHQI
jgi:hypothetical protein